uniref:Uncharacterized protein n=1 Tax=Romanomermis culicivorax TaxID=13658 RepID=A0A915I646_ROMCU
MASSAWSECPIDSLSLKRKNCNDPTKIRCSNRNHIKQQFKACGQDGQNLVLGNDSGRLCSSSKSPKLTNIRKGSLDFKQQSYQTPFRISV